MVKGRVAPSIVGAGRENRTLTSFRKPDFESGASTSSATPARGTGEVGPPRKGAKYKRDMLEIRPAVSPGTRIFSVVTATFSEKSASK